MANEFKGGMDTHTVVHVNDSRVTWAADKLSQIFFNMNTLQMTEIEWTAIPGVVKDKRIRRS